MFLRFGQIPAKKPQVGRIRYKVEGLWRVLKQDSTKVVFVRFLLKYCCSCYGECIRSAASDVKLI